MTVTLEATVQLALEKAHHALQHLGPSHARDCINNFVALSIEHRQRNEGGREVSKPLASRFGVSDDPSLAEPSTFLSFQHLETKCPENVSIDDEIASVILRRLKASKKLPEFIHVSPTDFQTVVNKRPGSRVVKSATSELSDPNTSCSAFYVIEVASIPFQVWSSWTVKDGSISWIFYSRESV